MYEQTRTGVKDSEPEKPGMPARQPYDLFARTIESGEFPTEPVIKLDDLGREIIDFQN